MNLFEQMKGQTDRLVATDKKLEGIVNGIEESNNLINRLLEDEDIQETESYLFESDDYDNYDDDYLFESDDYDDYDDDDDYLFESDDDDDDDLFESDDDDDDDDDYLFKSDDDDDDDDDDYLFESDDYLMENAKLGTITTHDGNEVSYELIEEGEYSQRLNDVVKQFTAVRRAKSYVLLEDALLDNLLESSHYGEQEDTFRKTGKKTTKKYKTGKKKGQEYTKREKIKRTRNSNKMNPGAVLEIMANQKTTKQIFRYNKALHKKLSKMIKEFQGDLPKPFIKDVQDNISWIFRDMKDVVNYFDAERGEWTSVEKVMDKVISDMSEADFKNKNIEYLGIRALELGVAITSKKDKKLAAAGIKFLKSKGEEVLDTLRKKAEAAATRRKEATAELLLEAIYDGSKVTGVYEAVLDTEGNAKIGKNGKPLKRRVKGKTTTKKFDTLTAFSGVGIDLSDKNEDKNTDELKGVKILIKALGAPLVASSVYGMGTGAYAFKFFAALNMAAKNSGKPTDTNVKFVNAIRNGRALAGHLAHTMKWINRFNKAGLFGAKIVEREVKKQPDNSFKTTKSNKELMGGDSIAKWIESNSGNIGALLNTKSPKGLWSGHYKNGTRKANEAKAKKDGIKKGKEVKKFLLEDTSYEDIAYIVELMF